MFAAIYSRKNGECEGLVDFAYAFSPLVEETTANSVVLDIGGCELLFGSAYELAVAVTNCASKPREAGGWDGKVNVAIAANPDTAVLAARYFEGITFIAPGEEQVGLGGLSIERLFSGAPAQPEAPAKEKTLKIGPWLLSEKRLVEILETLELWGVRTFADFAALPVSGVSERLGQEGLKLQQLASGKVERHLSLKPGAPVFANSIELEFPLTELEPLSFVLARLLNQVCSSLEAYALATNEIQITLGLEDQTIFEQKLNLPYPLRDHKVFLKLLLLDLELHPPQAAVIRVSLACVPVPPRTLQNGLFTPLAPEPEKLELTLARLARLVGATNVGSPELLDSHQPDAFRLNKFVIRTPDLKIKRRQKETVVKSEVLQRPVIGFRMFRPALRAIVEADKGHPKRISAWNKSNSLYGEIVRLAGPWRSTGNWWRRDSWARDEWDVAVEPRQPNAAADKPPLVVCRIYRELSANTWFVEGVYD